jgi:hypothetical protein
MKTLLFFLMACTAAFAQEFKATPTGLVAKKTPAQAYVVARFDSIPADTLYANAKRYLLSKYSGIKNPIVGDESGKLLRFETGDQVMSTLAGKGGETKYLGAATGTLEFKDGKVKISYGNIALKSVAGETVMELPLTSFWNKKGKIVEANAKNITETHFNASTRLLLDAMGKSNDKASATDW